MYVLNPRTVNHAALNPIRDELARRNPDEYTIESWQAVEAIIKEANDQKLQSDFDRIVASINIDEILVEKQIARIEIATVPKTSYSFGEKLDVTGGMIRVIYDNETSVEKEMQASWVTGFDSEDETKIGVPQQLTVTYEGKTAIYNVTITDNATGITITKPNKVTYQYGEEMDLTGLTVTLHMKSGATSEVELRQCSVTGYNSKSLGAQTISVQYLDYEAQTFTVLVEDYVKGIKIVFVPTKRVYTIKDTEIAKSGLRVETVNASGNVGENITNAITIDPVDFKTVGSKDVIVRYNGYMAIFTIAVVDSKKPVISLNGDAEVTVELGTEYVEQGAQAHVSVGGYNVDISNQIKIDKDKKEEEKVNVNKEGTYTVTYDVVYKATGEEATQVVRTVHVKDTTPPVITPDDNNVYVIEVNEPKPTYRATAKDVYTNKVTTVTTEDDIDVTIPGVYAVTFISVDEAGNEARVRKIVRVVDTKGPIIDVQNLQETIEANGTFDPLKGVCATDNSGEDIKVEVDLKNLDTTRVGTYTIAYTAKDSTGNSAETVYKTIEVKDTKAPTFVEFKGEETMYVEVNTPFVDPGVVFEDNYTVESALVINKVIKLVGTNEEVGAVDYRVVGNKYTITYTATDTSGNTSEEVTRTVMITDRPATIYFNDPALDGMVTDLKDTTKEKPQAFYYYPTIQYARGEEIGKGGEIVITKDGQPYTMPANGTITEDGEYVMMVYGVDENGDRDGTRAIAYFTVATRPPEVTGIARTGKYKEAQTVSISNIHGVEKAVLTDRKGNELVDVRQYLINNNTEQYEIPYEVGTFYLKVTPNNGRTVTYTIIYQ